MSRSTLALSTALLLPACYSGVSAPMEGGADTDTGVLPDSDGVDDSEGTETSDSGDDTGPAASCDGEPIELSASPLRRLTKDQYRFTLIDVLGDSLDLDDATSRFETLVEDRAGHFVSNVGLVDKEWARSYMLVAEAVAESLTAQENPNLPGCSWADSDCIDDFATSLGRRLFRRPLSDAERGRYLDLWAGQLEAHDEDTAMRALLTSMLASPNFLYIDETVDASQSDGQLVPLDEYGLASRLSYFLWMSAPDETLLNLADAGALDDPDVYAEQVERMLDDPRFDRALDVFHRELLEYNKLEWLEVEDPRWSESLRATMAAEPGALARAVFRDGSGTIAELLTADYTFGSPDLADIYGASAPDDQGRIVLDASRRHGLLTQTGFLAGTGAIFTDVHRGRIVRESLLCDTLPPVPSEDVDGQIDRQADPECWNCHKYMDPIGQSFFEYGKLGEFLEDSDADVTGEVIPIASVVPGTFEGVVELSELLAGSEAVERCFARQWSRFAVGRLESAAERCTMDSLESDVVDTGGDLRELVRGIAVSTRFTHRRADAISG